MINDSALILILQTLQDRAAVPGAAEQGHKQGLQGRRRRSHHRRGGLLGAAASVHADADHVHRLHHASGVAASPAHTRGRNAFVYIIEGEGVFGRESAAHHYLVLGADGDGLSVWNRPGAPLWFALAAGQPLKDRAPRSSRPWRATTTAATASRRPPSGAQPDSDQPLPIGAMNDADDNDDAMQLYWHGNIYFFDCALCVT